METPNQSSEHPRAAGFRPTPGALGTARSRLVTPRALLAKPATQLTIGLLISAAAGSGFNPVINRALNSTDVNALMSLNFLLITISTGAISGLEQEMTRVVSRTIAVGGDAAAAIRRQVRQSAWLITVTLVVVCALGPLLTARYLDGQWVLFAELLLALFGALASFQVRGTLSGRQDFAMYSVTLVVQGLGLLVPIVLLLVGNVGAAWLYGLFLALAQGFAALSGLLGARRRRLNGPIPTTAMASATVQETAPAPALEHESRARKNIALLTGATLASQLLLNSVPLLTLARYGHSADHAQLDLVDAISTAAGVTRLGILILLPLQTPLLPRLTAAAAHGRLHEVRRRTLALGGLCALVGLVGVAFCFIAGPWTLRVIMHAHATLSGGYLAALAAGIGFMMVAYILQSTLIALSRHVIVMVAWLAGVAATVPAFVGVSSILTATALAAWVGPLVTILIMAVDAWRSTGGGGWPAGAQVPDVAESPLSSPAH